MNAFGIALITLLSFIGLGALITGFVVGGVPAQIIKYRFPEVDIEKLLTLKLYDSDEKLFLKMREQSQTSDVETLAQLFINLNSST